MNIKLKDICRRLGLALLLIAAFDASAYAADTVRYGSQIGAQYSLHVLLKQNQAKYNLKYEFREFRAGTENMLALEQREVDVSTLTTQHLLRATEDPRSRTPSVAQYTAPK